jgi:hypothetical protein
MGLLDRLRPGAGDSTFRVHVRDATESFQGNKGDTIYSAGYAPVNEAGNRYGEDEHRTSHPSVWHARVTGTHHNPSALTDARFNNGARITLRPESGNPSDPNAVGVWDAAGSVQVGYLPASLSRTVAAGLRGGRSLSGQVVRELRLGSPDGRRTALYVLIAPPGRLDLIKR